MKCSVLTDGETELPSPPEGGRTFWNEVEVKPDSGGSKARVVVEFTPEEMVVLNDVAMPAIVELLGTLVALRRVYDGDSPDKHVCVILHALCEHLRRLRLPHEIWSPLYMLWGDKLDQNRFEEWRRRKGGSGRPPTSVRKAAPLSYAAAVVTVLKKRNVWSTIDEAAKAVAQASGLKKREIKQFRDNLIRHKPPADIQAGYQRHLDSFARYSVPDLMAGLAGLASLER